MEKTSFYQRSRLGAVAFELEGLQLRLSGKRGFVAINLEVDLRDISPHVERRRWRSFAFIAFPLGIAALCGLVVWLVPNLVVALLGSMFGLACLWIAVRNIAPIELVTFRSNAGVPVFEVIKNQAQADEFENFIVSLVSTIHASQARPEAE